MDVRQYFENTTWWLNVRESNINLIGSQSKLHCEMLKSCVQKDSSVAFRSFYFAFGIETLICTAPRCKGGNIILPCPLQTEGMVQLLACSRAAAQMCAFCPSPWLPDSIAMGSGLIGLVCEHIGCVSYCSTKAALERKKLVFLGWPDEQNQGEDKGNSRYKIES